MKGRLKKRLQDQLVDAWYLSRKEIEEKSPSRSDDIDMKKETYLHKSYCTLLQDLRIRLKVVFSLFMKADQKLYSETESTYPVMCGILPTIQAVVCVHFCSPFLSCDIDQALGAEMHILLGVLQLEFECNYVLPTDVAVWNLSPSSFYLQMRLSKSLEQGGAGHRQVMQAFLMFYCWVGSKERGF
ncbi:hypothetical protein Tco_1307662 [Tanacetum coccineum]